jgi:hypothetical protein
MGATALDDREFLASFEDLRIPGSEFRHRDHVRLAWIYLSEATLADGAFRFCTHFRRFVRHIGAEPKYHETITWFYLVTIHQRIQARPPASCWEEFAGANEDLLDSRMGMLRMRYRAETLLDPLARRIFLLPEISP